MEKNRKSILDKVEKKDLIYLFLAIDLILILIAVVVWKYSDAQLLVDQISFGSSIASIILAVVAMIYAFFQTQEASSQNAIVQEALYKISSQVDELNAIRDEINSFRLEQVAMKEQVVSIANNLGDISVQKDIPESAKKELKNVQEQLKDVIDTPVTTIATGVGAGRASKYKLRYQHYLVMSNVIFSISNILHNMYERKDIPDSIVQELKQVKNRLEHQQRMYGFYEFQVPTPLEYLKTDEDLDT
ncbi:hypothetical protein [Thermoactinomyces sp. DSM 45892]|uniref:hypothetical protein n=1 Tax=Thermoactinomyces sp. DSM 45892 TaxID=1882753 RepID=UPI0008956838|nr:hypothetical protein [Thermoactinomyces sp. DSM 45892]SDZ00548.1 hypothetical protein SAMN05444416_11197 [Thermoactinomyces sp. DSM 45892]